MKSWRTNLGGAVGTLGTALVGVGVLGHMGNEAYSRILLWIALIGFVVEAIGKSLTALFAADAADLVELQRKTVQAIDTGDTKRLVKPLGSKPETKLEAMPNTAKDGTDTSAS